MLWPPPERSANPKLSQTPRFPSSLKGGARDPELFGGIQDLSEGQLVEAFGCF